jgi:hypothetical protein
MSKLPVICILFVDDQKEPVCPKILSPLEPLDPDVPLDPEVPEEPDDPLEPDVPDEPAAPLDPAATKTSFKVFNVVL